MTWESKNFFGKKELWFFQTHLTSNEIKTLKLLCANNLSRSVSISYLLKKIVLKEERLGRLSLAYEKFCQSFHIVEGNITTKVELEFFMKKKMHECSPLALQFIGSKEILKKPLVAIIGSRHPTFYGREQTFRFAKELSAKGCTVISGGAIGIDSIANSVALERGGGSCAILGSGLKNLYPPSNSFLFNKLKHSHDGLILSEFSETEPPQKWNFPKRNHTIALLADFVLVIEATLTSGSLITAEAALDYGTDVGALPGGVDCSNSVGANSLIQRGAYCIQSPQDVFERVKYIYNQRAS
ncbi:MAG: DNA-processing protein DprA [Bdellovibrionota bacterium]